MNKENLALKNQQSSSLKLAEKISSLLQIHQISEINLARELNISLMTIRRLVSGETTDPRISTLKMIADYFNIPIETLLEDASELPLGKLKQEITQFIPVIDWQTASKITSIKEVDKQTLKEWQLITFGNHYSVTEEAFALESRPSMYLRFPNGTLFIIEPTIEPIDGDLVLVKIKKNGELSLREISIDPPEWKLHPIVPGSQSLLYSKKEYQIVGVVVLTMLYNRHK